MNSSAYSSSNASRRLLFYCGGWAYGIVTGPMDVFAILLTFPTFLILISQIKRLKSRDFLIDDIFWICILFFFIVGPCQALSEYGFVDGPTTGLRYQAIEFIIAEIIVILSLIPFCLGVGNESRPFRFRILDRVPSLSTGKILTILLVVVFSFGLFLVFSGGLANVLSPRTEKTREDTSFLSAAFLALVSVGTVILGIGANFYFSSIKKNRFIVGFCFLLATVLLLVCANPLNISRFVFVASWMPVFLAFFGAALGFGAIYIMVALGVLVFMPIASISTRVGLEGFDRFWESNYAKDLFIIKDLDLFDTLVHAVSMFRDRAYYLGDNIFAIIGFFVPRSFWEQKPIVGGLIVGNDLYHAMYAGTANLSFYFGGDLYMDFGVLGVLLGAIVVAWLWRRAKRQTVLILGGRNLLSLVIIGSLPILMRGPVGAVAGYFVCLIFSVFFYKIIIRTKFL